MPVEAIANCTRSRVRLSEIPMWACRVRGSTSGGGEACKKGSSKSGHWTHLSIPGRSLADLRFRWCPTSHGMAWHAMHRYGRSLGLAGGVSLLRGLWVDSRVRRSYMVLSVVFVCKENPASEMLQLQNNGTRTSGASSTGGKVHLQSIVSDRVDRQADVAVVLTRVGRAVLNID